MLDFILDALVDSLKLLPFLFLTYLVMGILERAASDRSKKLIKGAGRVGPIWGGLLGVIPQCGFSTVASNFYVGRLITIGTLISIYLSTSDEMLPIMISENVPIQTILKILAVKVVIGMVSGFFVDFALGWLVRKRKARTVEEVETCNCAGSILASAIGHTLKVFFFIFIFSLAINGLIYVVGEHALETVLSNIPVLGEILAGLVGLIPNCSASVAITQLYLDGIIGAGAMMSGLLVGAGVGLLVLVKENHHTKENLLIIATLYGLGVVWGIVIDILGVTF
ncbi:MAG: arsenic efflux protein [Clostridia bacterium]|nr:arsenic efflux protein [Clostridia bacterium]